MSIILYMYLRSCTIDQTIIIIVVYLGYFGFLKVFDVIEVEVEEIFNKGV